MRRRDFGASDEQPTPRPRPAPRQRRSPRPPAEGSAFLRDLPRTPPSALDPSFDPSFNAAFTAAPMATRFSAPSEEWSTTILPPLDSAAPGLSPLDALSLEPSILDQPAPKRPRKPRKPRAPRAAASAASAPPPATDDAFDAADSGLWAISPYMGDEPRPAESPAPRAYEPAWPPEYALEFAPGDATDDAPEMDTRADWEPEPAQSSPRPTGRQSTGRQSTGRQSTGRQRVQRLRPEERALVEQTTQIIRGLALVREDVTAASDAAPALWEQSTAHLPVTLVAGSSSARMAALPAKAPRRHRKGILAGMVACVLCLTAVGTLLYTTRVASGQAGDAQTPLVAAGHQTPSAKAHSTTSASDTSGIWNTSAGALSLGGGAGPGVKAPGSAGLPVKNPPKSSGSPTNGINVSPAPLSPWPPYAWTTVPGHPSFHVSYPADGFYGWSFGQCTWWAQNKRRDENLEHMGNAQYWAGGAASRGYTISAAPKPGATVVFQPGVQGAGGAGHVAHVEAVYPDGWFLISEMNFYWNGGGWGRVDYRYAHSGWGVQFIY